MKSCFLASFTSVLSLVWLYIIIIITLLLFSSSLFSLPTDKSQTQNIYSLKLHQIWISAFKLKLSIIILLIQHLNQSAHRLEGSRVFPIMHWGLKAASGFMRPSLMMSAWHHSRSWFRLCSTFFFAWTETVNADIQQAIPTSQNSKGTQHKSDRNVPSVDSSSNLLRQMSCDLHSLGPIRSELLW